MFFVVFLWLKLRRAVGFGLAHPRTRLTCITAVHKRRPQIHQGYFHSMPLPFDLSASIDMVKNIYSPSATLLSSGRKEYSATKITAYFSPKPSPIASPQVALDAKSKIETNTQIETKIEKNSKAEIRDRIQDTRETKAASTMPVATRKRSAQARAQPYPAPAPAQAQPQQPLRAVRDARSNHRSNVTQPPDTPTPTSSSRALNSQSGQANGHIQLPRPLDPSCPPASDPLITDTPVNVKNVIFGDLTFNCSYISRHVREIIGDKVAEKKEVLGRLCVCPHCFKYTKQIVQYIRHLPVCPLAEPLKLGDGDKKEITGSIERGSKVPGKRVYKHGEGWEVWELDGEDEQVRTVSDSLSSVDDICSTCLHLRSIYIDLIRFASDLSSIYTQNSKHTLTDRIVILPKPLPLRQALPRRQIRLLRCLLFHLLPPRPRHRSRMRGPSRRSLPRQEAHLSFLLRRGCNRRPSQRRYQRVPTSHRFLLQRKAILGLQQPSLHPYLSTLATQRTWLYSHGVELLYISC